MQNLKLISYYQKMKQMRVDEVMLIPWDAFIGGKAKEKKQKPISDGKMTWLTTTVDRGIEVSRLE